MADFNKDNKKRTGKRDFRRSDRKDSQEFGRRSSNRRDFGRSGRSNRRSEPVTMHPAVCDECGKDCEVPFKPTSSKPIYCKDCFMKKDKSGSRTNNSGQYEKEFVQINQKLDKILEALKTEKTKPKPKSKSKPKLESEPESE